MSTPNAATKTTKIGKATTPRSRFLAGRAASTAATFDIAVPPQFLDDSLERLAPRFVTRELVETLLAGLNSTHCPGQASIAAIFTAISNPAHSVMRVSLFRAAALRSLKRFSPYSTA